MTLQEFETQVEKYRERLTRVARRWVGDDAEDAVQAAFIQVWGKLDSLADGIDLGSYLYRSLRWRCLDIQRKAEADGELASQYAILTPAGAFGPDADDPQRDLETALASLKASEQVTAKGVIAGEEENGEPAPLKTRMRRFYVRKKLRKSLKAYVKETPNEQ